VNVGIDRQAFEGLGFSIIAENTDFLKVEKGHCEIYVSAEDGKTILQLPVIELFGKRKTSLPLMEYLLKRNAEMKGPGFFGIRDCCVYYIATLSACESAEQVALKMQETIEKLAPKLINVSDK
jgi:hypothetical protein